MFSEEAQEQSGGTVHERLMAEHPWYKDPKYERYWNHYKQMKAWMQDQQSLKGAWMQSYQQFVQQYHWWIYQNASHQAYYPHHHRYHHAYHPYPSNQSVHVGRDSYQPSKTRHHHMHHHQPYRPHPGAMSYRGNKQYTTDQSDVDYLDNGFSETQQEDDDDYGVGGEEEFEVELSEEMRQFFLQSQKHREELKEMKLALNKRKNEEETKDGDEVKDVTREEASYDDEFEMSFNKSKKSKKKHIIGAPVEQPGKRRAEEMKVLYGSDSPAIHGMETAIQMQFDRNCDKKQPTFWPTVALKM